MQNKQKPEPKKKKKSVLIPVIIVVAVVAAIVAVIVKVSPKSLGLIKNSKIAKNKSGKANLKTPGKVGIDSIKKPFSKSKTVTVKQLNREIETFAATLEKSKIKKDQFLKFAGDFNIAPTDDNFRKYIRAALIFEATRDAGLWHIQWKITDKEPNSDHIWAQWKKSPCSDLLKIPTAYAECDEISALFAFLMRKNGNLNTGLYWPTKNHTVAVWKLKSVEGKEVRVVIPTTQIFLNNRGLFGTNRFDPYKQKEIYDYTREDASLSTPLPAELANFFIMQIYKYGGASEDTLQYLRGVREAIWVGTDFQSDAKKELESTLANYRQNNADPADIRALEYFRDEFLR
ncbi:MAG: hypothetical protein LWY06_11285 [Firmicutes bacterium]|nr:hypothetical protein [Bacillota bacterium]